MQTSVALKETENTPLSRLKNTFKRHLQTINKLRLQLKFTKQQCEAAFLLYHSDLKPKEKQGN